MTWLLARPTIDQTVRLPVLLNALKLPSLLIANEIQFAGRLLPHQNVVRARVPVARTLITIFFETARPETA